MMKSWYDGYTFPSVPHVYNPKSVVDSIRRKRFGSYWTQTETYEALKIYIDIDYAGLKDDSDRSEVFIPNTEIREKRYADSLKDYKGNILLVGINYDKKTKKHDCMIEKNET